MASFTSFVVDPGTRFTRVSWVLIPLVLQQRTCMGSEIISTNLIDKCADMHARMYVRGDGSVVK